MIQSYDYVSASEVTLLTEMGKDVLYQNKQLPHIRYQYRFDFFGWISLLWGSIQHVLAKPHTVHQRLSYMVDLWYCYIYSIELYKLLAAMQEIHSAQQYYEIPECFPGILTRIIRETYR